jgi:hypothetical protein
MTTTTPFVSFGPALTVRELVSMLALTEHQIRAAVDPACAACSLGEADQRAWSGAMARLDSLVRDCARTGCPPCRRRAGG